MYIKRFPKRSDGDYSVFIAMSVKGSKQRKIIERYDSYFDLKKKYGDAEKYLKDRINLLSQEYLTDDDCVDVKIDLNKPIDISEFDFNASKNAGYLFLQKAYYDLGIESFLNKWKFSSNSKIEYSLNNAFRFLVYARVEEPCSELAVSKKNHDYLEDFDCSLDDLYDCLDRIDTFSQQLTKKLSKVCSKQFGGHSEAIYYDCTNFYFEIQNPDDENGLRDYGVEKNHRPDPIVEYGLLLDERGFPIGSATFRGGKSEKESLIPLLSGAGEEATKAKIIVADNGLNCETNKKAIHDTGRNYIFCQSPKQLSEANLSPLFDEKGWENYDHNKKVKSWWIKRGNGREERLVARFDQASCDFVNHTIDQRIERAKKFINNPSRLTYKNCQDGKQYIEKIVVDKKTGEVLKDKSVLSLNSNLIEKDRKYAGYILYVTDIPRLKDNEDGSFTKAAKQGYRVEYKEDIEIIKIAGRRNDIEDCFRKMKTGMDAHPIFVRTPEHIRAHLFTVYIALTLLMYIQGRYAKDMTTEKLLQAIRNYVICRFDDKKLLFATGYYNKEINELNEKMNFKTMNRKYLNWPMIKKLISKSKNKE